MLNSLSRRLFNDAIYASSEAGVLGIAQVVVSVEVVHPIVNTITTCRIKRRSLTHSAKANIPVGDSERQSICVACAFTGLGYHTGMTIPRTP